MHKNCVNYLGPNSTVKSCEQDGILELNLKDENSMKRDRPTIFMILGFFTRSDHVILHPSQKAGVNEIGSLRENSSIQNAK